VNTVSAAGGLRPASGGRLRFAFAALRSMRRAEFAYFACLALAIGALNTAWMLESLLKGGKTESLLLGVAIPLLVMPIMLAAWVIADRADGAHWPRKRRLALAVLVGAAAAGLLVPPLLGALGFAPPEMRRPDETRVAIPSWVVWITLFIETALYTGLGVAVLEMHRRRAQALRQLEAARHAQVRLARELLESRLAAMQAQVEPRFLFDTLVDVQATYDRDAARGADAMDRLITYLRVALPRLRESGSTVQAEVDLLAAYLAVVAARHDGRPAVAFAVAPDCAQARFFPMLLLPLVQRALRGGAPAPERVELTVQRAGDAIAAELRIASPSLCDEDAELARVRDRLAGLYDGRARLECRAPTPATSLFTLYVPQ
jgi:hypothetical protein